MKKYPQDAHLLPYMDRGWICFPDWAYRHSDLVCRFCSWIGETFNKGQYCFTVDRNIEEQWEKVE